MISTLEPDIYGFDSWPHVLAKTLDKTLETSWYQFTHL